MPRVGDKGLTPYWSSGRSRVYVGDCVEVMRRLPSESVDFIFADPPFNIGYEYDVYNDKREKEDYLAWSTGWIGECERLLAPSGSIYVAIGNKYSAEIKLLLESVGLRWRSTIAWHYGFGPRQETNWTPSWVPIHYLVKGKGYTWNPDAVRVPSSRQLVYSDKRAKANGKVPNNFWALTNEDTARSVRDGEDVLLASRVCGTFKERTGHPCQMPELVLERIIRASSNLGDVVLDPFLGSGTTAAVAIREGRRAIGIELSKDYVEKCCVERLSRARSQDTAKG